MEISRLLNKIAEECGLGTITAQVKRVSGGYMHKMVCLETATGKYAVKLLNPVIMKRPDVFTNYRTAEELEQVLQENGIPLVPALEFNDKKMQCVDHQYFYVFPWVDGRALRPGEIQKEHCEAAGTLLARIHKTKQMQSQPAEEGTCIAWDAYTKLATDKCPEIADLLLENRELLYTSWEEGNRARREVPAITSICNGDMDSKNVLWVKGEPKLIDLESLRYGNPYPEFFSLALSWSGCEHGSVNYENLRAFIRAYRQIYGAIEADWSVLYSCNTGWLSWLEYNVKRALRIECENEEERGLGIAQVIYTMRHILYYRAIREELLEQLNALPD